MDAFDELDLMDDAIDGAKAHEQEALPFDPDEELRRDDFETIEEADAEGLDRRVDDRLVDFDAFAGDLGRFDLDL